MPTDKHMKAMTERKDSFHQFIRNGIWGTCVDCPRDSEGKVYPEFCENTERYDHKLTLEQLAENYRAHCR